MSEPQAKITGRLLLGDSPVAHFGACLAEPLRVARRVVEVRNAMGVFELPAGPGIWNLALLGRGTKIRTIRDIVVQPGDSIDLGDVHLEPGYRIQGCVRDRSGSPVALARVTIGRGLLSNERVNEIQQWFGGEYHAVTDVTGRYLFDGVAQPDHYELPPYISVAHAELGASRVHTCPVDDATVDFELIETGGIKGFVDGLGGGHRFVKAVAPAEPPNARWMSVDARGEFRFLNIPIGEYAVSVFGGDGKSHMYDKVIVNCGEFAQISFLQRPARVRLRVRVPPGREAELRLECIGETERGTLRSMRAKGRGEVVFDELLPGRYRASLDGVLWREFEVLPASRHEQFTDVE